ncbi:hypothetical protein DMC30DRAFT_348812 [Rhodotorula diobovata]|uniref:Stress-response A/B barrel domain-containing protein n=1 Tax=Rhodotorula diobovata TaxID=5288 RepID=A0A5C5G2F6_9BASI|nr:hypothetical protein DMC30DRAFT_348812 [Rhodotorula diobovata]
MAPITHLVSFRYKPSTSSAEKHLVASSFLALQDQCTLHDRPYVSVTGGANNSSEGADKGLEHAFVLTFSSLEERDYYVSEDPAHAKFKELAGQHVDDVFVLDFEGGKF